MTSPRRRLLSAIASLAALSALLVGAPQAQAAGESLQVNKEVNTVPGGTPVTLTARLADAATTDLTINFTAEPASPGAPNPATPTIRSCPIAAGASSCQVSFSATSKGTSLIRAHVGGEGDMSEGRLSNAELMLPILSSPADCRGTDDDKALENTCSPSGAAVVPGANSEPDNTDVVQITWTSFVDGRLDCDDANPANGEDVEYNDSKGIRDEAYTCTLTSLDTPPVPIAGAKIDAERLGGLGDSDGDADGTADMDDFCTTDANGRCTASVQTLTGEGATTICFWAEPGDVGVTNDDFSKTGTAIDGGDCDGGGEPVDEAEGNDITDAVLLDINVPRATRLDAGPESAISGPNSRFSFAARVWDQFGNPFLADTEIRAEYFSGSPLDTDGNTPSSPDASCRTGTGGLCSITTASQSALGTDLVCIWLDTPESRVDEMIGNGGDAADGSCGDSDDNRFDEVPLDPSSDGNGDTVPQPVTDGRDIIRLKVESRPFILQVKPEEKRQAGSDVFRVLGSSFYPGARITVSGAGVNVGPTSRVSEFELAASFDVAADAAPGLRDVTVTNFDGGTATCGRCFNVIGQGYWLAASDGGIFAFGDAKFAGSTGDRVLNKPIVGMAPTPSGKGYWLAASDGGIFAFGDAFFYGSTGNVLLNKPIVGIAAHPSGKGYWLVASDGGIFAFGDAKFYGSTGKLPLNQPIVGITAHPGGRGYWLVAADGGIFAFGDAAFHGSTGGVKLNKPIVGIAPSGTGKGYWLVASDGGIFSFGDAAFHGSTGAVRLNQPILGMMPTPLAKGYWLVAADGGIFSFGDAAFHGSTGGMKLNQPIIGFARR
jgi:hypothetical protein